MRWFNRQRSYATGETQREYSAEVSSQSALLEDPSTSVCQTCKSAFALARPSNANSDLNNQLALHAASLEPRNALACVLKLQLGLDDNLD